MKQHWEIPSQRQDFHELRGIGRNAQRQALPALDAGRVAGRHTVAFDIDNQDFEPNAAVYAMPKHPHDLVVAMAPCGIKDRLRAWNAQGGAVLHLLNIGEFVKAVIHHPARGGREATSAGAPMTLDFSHATPLHVISNSIGSGRLAFGSSIVARNLRPPTSLR